MARYSPNVAILARHFPQLDWLQEPSQVTEPTDITQFRSAGGSRAEELSPFPAETIGSTFEILNSSKKAFSDTTCSHLLGKS